MAKLNYFTYVWVVENVNPFYRKPVKSPTFHIPSIIDSEFCMKLFLEDDDEPGLMSTAFLARSNNKITEMEFELAILASDGSRLIEHKFDYKDRVYVPRDEVFVKRKSAFLPNNTLTLQFKMSLNEAGYCFARTRLGIEKYFVPWIHKDISISYKNLKYSPEEQTPKDELLRFQIFWQRCCEDKLTVELRPYIINDDDDDESNDEGDEDDDEEDDVDCYTCKISLLDASGQEKSILDETRFDYDSIETISLPLTRNMLQEEPNKYLINGALSLNCLFTFYSGAIMNEKEFRSYGKCYHPDYSSRSFNVDMDEVAATLKDDLRSLYNDPIFYDFIIYAEGRSFPVHKNILLSRSPFLRSVIIRESSENGKQELHVTDTADTMHRFLLYLYTDAVEDMEWEQALKLFVTADKFKVPTLMKKCSLILKEKLTISNVCDILLLAHEYHDEDMKSSIHDFILGHDVAILNSTRWIEMESSQSWVAAETLRIIYFKKGK